ncbi:MAG: D-amino acid aminotransferase [Proteobacteria bacterium]|nr:D-amino acid aminotransferase [Pseudomonadota bacterium]
MSGSICYLNGNWEALADAKVSVLDRGFIFGDGIYEVIPVFSGIAFRLPEHLNRLEESLAATGIKNPFNRGAWVSIINQLVATNHGGDQSIYLQVTRGIAPRNHVLLEEVQPTVFLMSSPLVSNGPTTAIAAITLPDFRWQRCDIKTTSLLANVMSRFEASRLGSEEAIFIRDGFVTEGASSNVFVVKSGRIKTPPLSPGILPGVTRNLLVELSRGPDLVIEQAMVSKDELADADEVWVTSSGREMVPVVRIDDRPIGNGDVGPFFHEAQSIYREFKRRFSELEN